MPEILEFKNNFNNRIKIRIKQKLIWETQAKQDSRIKIQGKGKKTAFLAMLGSHYASDLVS